MACNQGDQKRVAGNLNVPLRPNGEPVNANSDYDPRLCNRIIEFAKSGMSLAEMCTEIGISKRRAEQWRRYEEWDEALDSALTAYEAHMNKIGYQHLEKVRGGPELATDIWKDLKASSRSKEEIKEEVKQNSARLNEVVGELLGIKPMESKDE